MNQLNLKLSATMNRPIAMTAWSVERPVVSRGFVVVTLAALSWGVLWAVVDLLFLRG